MQSFGGAQNVKLCLPAPEIPGCGPLAASLAEVGARATSQINGTKALPGSVRVHMQSFEAAQILTLC